MSLSLYPWVSSLPEFVIIIYSKWVKLNKGLQPLRECGEQYPAMLEICFVCWFFQWGQRASAAWKPWLWASNLYWWCYCPLLQAFSWISESWWISYGTDILQACGLIVKLMSVVVCGFSYFVLAVLFSGFFYLLTSILCCDISSVWHPVVNTGKLGLLAGNTI